MTLLFVSFIAGLLTVLAPCTISLLPVIVGGSVSGKPSIRRAIVVTTSLGISVIFFTLILKVSTAFINVPQSFWEIFSGVIITFIGLTMIFPELWESLPFLNTLNRDSNKLIATGYNKQNFLGDMLIGAALGPVFSSCSPTYFLILATVLPKSIVEGLVYLFAYTIGLCGALFFIAIASQKAMEKIGVASDPKGWIKRSIGIFFVILGILIAFGIDKQIELAATESGFFDVTQLEQNLLQKTAPEASLIASSTASTTAPVNTNAAERIALKASMYQKAPEITDPSGFINTNGQPITIGQFKGKKVVLIDFWTYSCINCQRAEPYISAWYDKYSNDGLEIIGIHTPEFGFEKVQSNVEEGVKADGIKYPVVMDNNYGTWNAFQNQYWPRQYLIDIDGYIVYDHAGEGDYDKTEEAIQKALAERDAVVGAQQTIPDTIATPKNAVSVDVSQSISPETYFGSARNEFLGNGVLGLSGVQNLNLPQSFDVNMLYLSGNWNFQSEYAESQATGTKIIYKYMAKNLYFVASSKNGTKISIILDGKPLSSMAGTDVGSDSTATIQEDRLYNLVQGQDYGEHTIEIDSDAPGLDAYTFTFG